MYIDIISNIGDTIYIYDPEDDREYEKTIDNLIITGEHDNLMITYNNIILRADAYDDVICTYDNLINTKPDEGGVYYFRCEKSRKLFKDSRKGDN